MQKGQVNSPFELLVAIVIMGFVVIIGSQMIVTTNEQVCLSQVEKEMQEFKLNLENTSEYRTSIKFEFRPNENTCYKESQSIMKIEKYNNSKKCGLVCGKATDSCFVLIFYAPDLANGSKSKCLNLPVYTSFVEDSTNCPTGQAEGLDGYKPINPTMKDQTLISGTYVLKNVAPAAKTYPQICTFRK